MGKEMETVPAAISIDHTGTIDEVFEKLQELVG